MLDIEKYAEIVANIKNIDDSDTISRLKKVLRDTLSARYYAVCVDIDGALVDEKLSNLQSVDIISRLLRGNIPIVLTTGRGENSTRDFVGNLRKELDENNKDVFKLISCVCNNGSILMYSSGESETFLDQTRLLANKEDVDKLTVFNGELLTQIQEEYENNVIVIPSYSSSLDCVTNIRFRIKNNEISKQLLEDLSKKLKDKEKTDGNIYRLSIGHYNGDLIYQICVTDNAQSIKQAEYILGIPENSMLRICDEGSRHGNDYNILNVSQAFSTGTISTNPFACFPIVNEEGDVLNGIEATKYLVQNLEIHPSICLEKADILRQRHLLAIAEKNIIHGGTKFMDREDRKYQEEFGVNKGLYDVYDEDTGGIKFYDYEWELIPNDNPFKEIFNISDKGKCGRKLENNNSVILRGSDTYYYFLANCASNKEMKPEELTEWVHNNLTLINDFSDAIKLQLPNDMVNKRFKMGILDNIRNLSLIMLNSMMVNEFNGSNVHILFDTYKENPKINNWVNVCQQISENMGKITTSVLVDDNDILSLLNKIKEIYSEDVREVLNKNNEKLNAKCFRNYREIDCYGENRLTLDFAIQKIKQENREICEKNVSFNGMAYGGLELPFIAKEILNNHQKIVLGGIIHDGNYGDRHSKSIRDFEKEKFRIFGDRRELEGHNIVTDDNVLTGKTLQIALNGLFNNGIDVKDIIAVRYPSMNRVAQMFNSNHGAIDTTHFFTYIKGLLIPSPYSKLGYFAKEEINNNGISPYKDEFNVFDIRKRKIYEYIYKSGKYKQGSKVEQELGVERIYD